MKMTKFFAMALPLCVGALLAGCNDAAVEEEIAPAATTYTTSATIEKDADGTRTNLTQIDETYYRNYWETGDKVSMFPYGTANRKGTLDLGENTSVGVFKWTYNESEGKKCNTHYGVFPYSTKNKVTNGTICTELPAEQTYNEGSIGGQNTYMTAYSEVDTDGGHTLNYQYYHGALGIKLYGDAKVAQIRVTANKNIAGEVTIQTPYLTTTGYPEAIPTTYAKNTVTFNCGANGDLTGTTASAPRLFSIALLTGTINNLKVEVLDAAGHILLTKTATNKSIEIARNKIKPMPAFEVMGPANCYIITKAGTYKFPAKHVDGTDVNLTYADGSNLTTPYNFDIVDWVWKTPGIELTGIKYENGYIYFTVNNFVEGSASIAAYDEKQQETLHNWHIWFTDKPQEIVMGSQTWLDRHLGAITTTISSADSYGLLYQWGRKDPMANQLQNSVNMLPELNTATWSEIYNYGEEYTTFKWKLLNGKDNTPYLFINEIAYVNDFPVTYLNAYNYYNNNTGERDYNWFNNYSENYNYLWSTSKTNFDPCPYGYKVPSNLDYQSISVARIQQEYPLQMWFRTSDGGLYQYRATWTSTSGSIDGLDVAYSAFIFNNTLYYDGNYAVQYRSDALPVRCIKE